ncbi:MAG: chorismate-binding protein [Spirulina sp. SIO3F2]|nr:chorismate-binding protein [Spirulina sp. SIO3F2]
MRREDFSEDFWLLAQWIAGDFSNQKQAWANPTDFAHIHVFFRPLPWEVFNGVGFYSEQAYDYDLWSPYRQGVHHFIEQDEQIYIKNFGLNDPILHAGASRDDTILQTIQPGCFTQRCGCAMVFYREGNKFIGQVEPGKNCMIPRNGVNTYLVSEVELTEATWVSRDRGFDPETDQMVWGSASGPLEFEKQASFAHELSQLK